MLITLLMVIFNPLFLATVSKTFISFKHNKTLGIYFLADYILFLAINPKHILAKIKGGI